ncbi:MAG: carotenoid biosynthesis protein [Chthoniobacteraceae bacterium]
MATRRPSRFSRALEPFSSSLWTLFLIWTAIVTVVWVGEIGHADLHQRVANPGLLDALEFFLRSLDAAWFVLAAANVYLALAGEESLVVARRWAAIVLFGAWLVSALSEWTAMPLGAIHYTARLGMRIGPVPFGLLLMWLAFVVGARALSMRLAPRASHLQVSLAAGVLAALTAANLDPLAWKFRAFWLWRTDAGQTWAFAQNIATWLLASFGFAFAMRETRVASTAFSGFPRPAIVLLIFNGVFLATHIARTVRG